MIGPRGLADYRLEDFDGHQITLGTRVRMWDDPPDTELVGTVIDMGEFDGDVDDDGRSIAIYPRVTVRWPNGDDEWWTSEWEFDGWAWEREPMLGKVEELAVVEREEDS